MQNVEMVDVQNLFPKTYEESRTRFRQMLPKLKEMWPDAALHQQPLDAFPEITIDWITAKPNRTAEKMLVFTTGEHGIEGYVGSAMLELFHQKFSPKLDPDTTGITLVHMINPWGMKNNRRTNPNNVDLNRNFVWDNSEMDLDFNPLYARIKNFVCPQNQFKSIFWENTLFLFKYATQLISLGKARVWDAKIMGQYAYPGGIHYGGNAIQEEVLLVQSIYRNAFQACHRLLHLDMHTGYGPRYQMTLVNSPLEPISSTEFKSTFNYPLVAAMNPEEFYQVRGDMIDFVYLLRNKEFPAVELYATSFEFGTFGSSHRERLRSLRAMVFENQSFQHGAVNLDVEKAVQQEFLESFSPSETGWREKAAADAEQAFWGILKSQGFISP